ncbi:MAG TPA: formate dehydrogenase accessory sulfurtransferase FdhD [Gemmatimonadota bacterium]|nr:formate dehydrogenase accessory sulfurtransferase FdhD [Gemmatimonadota bacterium]
MAADARDAPDAPGGGLSVRRTAWRVEAGGAEVRSVDEEVVAEHPVTLVVNGIELATLVCSPSHVDELALGFLTAEGILRPGEPIDRFFVDAGRGRVVVEAPGRDMEAERATFGKRYVGSCCGKSRTGFYLANDARTARRVEAPLHVAPGACFALMEALQEASPVFGRTGGVHNAGLASGGELEVVRTDIGRHNTLDKLYGWALRRDADLSRRLVAFSGRISSEIVLKVAKMGSPILVSKSAPTELALQMADDLGITAVGFARGDRLNVYTHHDRVLGERSAPDGDVPPGQHGAPEGREAQ